MPAPIPKVGGTVALRGQAKALLLEGRPAEALPHFREVIETTDPILRADIDFIDVGTCHWYLRWRPVRRRRLSMLKWRVESYCKVRLLNHTRVGWCPEAEMQLPDFLSRDGYGSIHLTGHRIDLAHLLHFYNEGYSPEMLACEYPALPLELIQRALDYYQAHRAEVDSYLARCREEVERQRASAPAIPTMEDLRRRLEARRPAEGA